MADGVLRVRLRHMLHPTAASGFALSPAQRAARAREQFFEQGLRPSGLVSEAVIQSWSRCAMSHARPEDRVAFNPVTRSRVHATLGRSRQLLEVAGEEIARLERSIAGTDCRVLLTDPQGVIIHATQRGQAAPRGVLALASRVGVDLSESAIGTNAPGIVVRSGQSVTVYGGEHFHDAVGDVHCAAAPIRDRDGRLAGVLDLSIECRRFGFDAAAVVALHGIAIENRLLLSQSEDLLIVRLHTDPTLLATHMAGLLALQGDGRLAWANAVALRLLGPADPHVPGTERLGADLTSLLALHRHPGPAPHRLPNGLGVWIEVRAPRRDGLERPVPAERAPAWAQSQEPSPAVDTGATLGASRRALFRRTLAEHGGNVAATARALGVSRGLVYRALR